MDKVKSRPNPNRRSAEARRQHPRAKNQTAWPRRAMRMLMVVGLASVTAFFTQTARAQNTQMPTQIAVGGPAQSQAGQALTVQAVLADNQGHPISKEAIYFTTPSTFLGDSSEVVLAEAVTNADGQAVAQFADDFSGTMELRAEFRGDGQYAASAAAIQITTTGEGQVYVEHVGVDIPGFNVPPVSAPAASLDSQQQSLPGFIQNLWPAMNGWPVAAVLLLVWSMYLLVVTLIVRIAAQGSEAEELPPFDSRRPS